MPDYEFYCRRCDKRFSAHMSVKEHDGENPPCPQCKRADEIQHAISHVNIQTTRKSTAG